MLVKLFLTLCLIYLISADTNSGVDPNADPKADDANADNGIRDGDDDSSKDNDPSHDSDERYGIDPPNNKVDSDGDLKVNNDGSSKDKDPSQGDYDERYGIEPPNKGDDSDAASDPNVELRTQAKKKAGKSGSERDTNLYSRIGPCSEKILNRRLKSFNIEMIANKGYFNYAYATTMPENTICAKFEIHGDADIGYRGSLRLLGKEGYTNTFYDLKDLGEGVISETLTTQEDGNPVKLEFKLVVFDYDLSKKILYYARCSDYGTNDLQDIRSIGVEQCSSKSFATLAEAFRIAYRDGQNGFKGSPLYIKKLCK